MTEQIVDLRAQIEALDDQLVELIGRRLSLARTIGREKMSAEVPIVDPAREAAVVARVAAAAREHDVPEDEMRALFWRVLAMSRRAQQMPVNAPPAQATTCR
jgi:chorismate mutase